jgi:predicted  nucleic acid-binding Zn-ribbon protein
MWAMQPLLEIQRSDTELEQLRHRRAALPARSVLSEAEAAVVRAEEALAAASEERHRIDRDQRRLEDEIAVLTEKAEKADRQLYGGGVSAIKELQALQEEIAVLGRRQRELEDQVLELMEAAEPIDDRIAGLQADRDAAEATAATARAEVAEGEAEVDDRIAEVEARRAVLVAEVDPADLRRYESLRGRFGSSTVVTFDGRNCVGCPLSMPAVEADRVKHEPAGALLDCGECERLVLR